MTHGSKYSSHCLATAYWGATQNIPVRLLILEKDSADISKYPHLKLAKYLGAELLFIDPSRAQERIDEERRQFHTYYWVPGGGHTRAGMNAYKDWFCKILNESPDLKSREWIALPYGTGTTALGILYAIFEIGLEMKVIGVSVSRTKKKCLEAAAEIVGQGLIKEITKNLIIDDRFSGRYGQIEEHHNELRFMFLKSFGILVDPIYNIRVVEYLESTRLENGIMINTGGQLNNLIS